MKSYRENLQKVKELNIDLTSAFIANEVECIFYKLSDSDFESVCSLVERIYLKTEESCINKIVNDLFDLIEEGHTIKELEDKSVWEVLELCE